MFYSVKIDEFKNVLVVFERHGDSTYLKPIYKFFKINSAIKINIKMPKCYSVVSELLLEPVMDLSQQLLDVVEVSYVHQWLFGLIGALAPPVPRLVDANVVLVAWHRKGFPHDIGIICVAFR